ncbi:diguanylate cyclase domain-containing protein [Variovorax paradoxus]|uniref:sensor domain-containing diguanylate cyclase n=1 Tax=Variovorax paradoxus TaxID=34073 RepID=UPI0019333BFA|nr:diguanylate cyclase [Variovorax paradoxus]
MNRIGLFPRTTFQPESARPRPASFIPWLIAVQLFVLVPMLAFSVYVTTRMGDQAEARERQLLLDKANSTAAAMAREADRLRASAHLLAALPGASQPLDVLAGAGEASAALLAVYRPHHAQPLADASAVRVGLRPEGFSVVLREQIWPEGWVASVVDAGGKVVARSRDEDRYLGHHATPQLRQKIAGADRSVSSTLTLDGLKVLSTIAPVPGTAWWVAVGVPEDTLNRSARNPLASLLGMGSCLVVLGLAASALIARRLNREFRPAFLNVPDVVVPTATARALTVPGPAAEAMPKADVAAEVAPAPEDMARDDITGLPLPEVFLAQVRQARSVAENSPGFLWCAISVELGGLAGARDRLGEEAAERLLQAFVGRMRRSVRPGDACGRVDADTFVIVLTGPRDGLAQAAERVGSSLVRGARALGHGLDCKVGFAIGDPARPVTAVLEQAAHARQEARFDGASATRWFNVIA